MAGLVEIIDFFLENRILLAGLLGVFLVILFFWLKFTQIIIKFQEKHSQEVLEAITMIASEKDSMQEEMRQLRAKLELITTLYKASVDKQSTEQRKSSKRQDK